MTKKAVLFDLGGTLLVMRRDRIFRKVLSQEGYRASVAKIHSAYAVVESAWLKRYGYRNLSPEKSMESYRRLDAMAFRQIFPRAPPKEALRMSRLLRKRWPEIGKTVPPKLYPDVEPTLGRLKRRGISLALVSNAPPDTMDLVESLGLQRYFQQFVISGVVGVSKPNPEIFRLALSSVGAGPSETMHVGDVYEADVVGARNAGIMGILIDRDGSARSYDCPQIRSLEGVFQYLS